MKKLIYIIFVILICNNSAQSFEFQKFKCKSKTHDDVSEFELVHTYENGFIVFYHTIMDIKFLNFGHDGENNIRSIMNTGSSLMYYEITKQDNENIKIQFADFESDIIKNLNTKSIFYGKTADKVNLILNKEQLDKEINNLMINQDYLIDLYNNRKDQINNELTMTEEYSCRKVNKSSSNKPSKDHIETIRLGCIGDNPYEKHKLYCTCVSNWFYENLNKNELAEFLFSGDDEKKNFLIKNKITERCKSLSDLNMDGTRKIEKIN